MNCDLVATDAPFFAGAGDLVFCGEELARKGTEAAIDVSNLAKNPSKPA